MEEDKKDKSRKGLIIFIIVLLIVVIASISIWFFYFEKNDLDFCVRDSECNQYDQQIGPYDTPLKNFCQNFSCQQVSCQENDDCQDDCNQMADDFRKRGNPILIIGSSCASGVCSCIYKRVP